VTNPSSAGEDFLVDGTSLMTQAYAISTITGTERLPPKVGDNIRVPYRHGQVWKPKTFDQQVITLGMWVRGVDVNGNLSGDARAQYRSNLRTLKKLFAPTGRQLSLQRTVLWSTGLTTHTGLGEASSQMDVTGVSRSAGTFTVDLRMADPWWYGSQIVTPGITSAGATVNNPGDVEVSAMKLRFNGPLNGPMLTNTSITTGFGPGGNVLLLLAMNIAAGHYVDVDTTAFTAIDDTSISQIVYVAHQGSQRWMILAPGNNVFTLGNWTGGAVGAGNVVITYSPPYI